MIYDLIPAIVLAWGSVGFGVGLIFIAYAHMRDELREPMFSITLVFFCLAAWPMFLYGMVEDAKRST